MLGLPYIQGLSKQLSRTYQSHGVYLFHKPSNTICSMLVHPKDKTPKEKLCGTIYHITCDDYTLHTYIGERKRPLSVRFKEHCKLDKPTGVGDHCKATGHSVSMDNVRVLDREQDWLKRKVKEAIHIKQRAPSMRPGLPVATHLWSDHSATTTTWAESPTLIIAWSRSAGGNRFTLSSKVSKI